MQNRVTYEYAIIRLVPKVERQEFINIGVILFSKRKRYLAMRYKIDNNKILAISADVDLDLIKKHLEAWVFVCKGAPHGGFIGEFEMPYRFRWMVASRSTIIQSSPTHSGLLNKEPDVELEYLFNYFVS